MEFLQCRDLGGRDKIRALHRMYYQNTNGIIFCVDSNDGDWMDQAKDELWKTIKDDQIVGVPLLVFANKQDLPNSLKVSEIVDRLGLNDIKGRPWRAFPCSSPFEYCASFSPSFRHTSLFISHWRWYLRRPRLAISCCDEHSCSVGQN
jgi:hypothetical protein